MSDIVISAERLGKAYTIGHERRERYTALRDVIARAASSIMRKTADMLHGRPVVNGDEHEEVWALRDVSFEVRRGEVVGIIGANGAGKSTLLKILSRITEPTEGRAIITGRVASLLEVGTGFHPELTGRENIFLNGSVLGMSRAEVAKKLDDIVAFAEVARFLDTPVKRYSSGMYVRLAFAVAAHLEQEILIVDEVLAVGDAEFQKRCLGKLSDVVTSGRTVLFVSHNMAAIQSVTQRCIVLRASRLAFDGVTGEAIRRYAEAGTVRAALPLRGRGSHTRILSAVLVDNEGNPTAYYVPGKTFDIRVELETDGSPRISLEVFIVDGYRQKLALGSLQQFHGVALPGTPGRYLVRMQLSPLWLASGSYSIDVTTSVVNSHWDHYANEAIIFQVTYCNPGRLSWDYRCEYGMGMIALPSVSEPEIVLCESQPCTVAVYEGKY